MKIKKKLKKNGKFQKIVISKKVGSFSSPGKKELARRAERSAKPHKTRIEAMSELECESEPTLYIIHENDAWLDPLRAALHTLGVPFVEWCVTQQSSSPRPERIL